MKSKPYLLAKAWIIFFLAIPCLWGCAPKADVLFEGYPAPTEYNITWSPDKTIEARWSFVSWYPKEIKSKGFSEVIDHPEYLTGDQLNVLDSTIKWVDVNLQINNPFRKKYKITKVVTIGQDSREFPLGGWTNRESNNLVVTGPIAPTKEIKLTINLISEETDGSQAPVLFIGDLRYLVKSPQT
jgi:hypothetical protein